MANRVMHFEVQADDVERAKGFYEKTFGWKIEQIMAAWFARGLDTEGNKFGLLQPTEWQPR